MADPAVEMTDLRPGRGSAPVRLAELKAGLSAERRALAEDLRALFGALGITVRRYAARRHLDASSVTRYLNGERVPPWDFVAGLIADVGESSAPLTAQAEEALRDTHRSALSANRRSSRLQNLQDKLASADEETRRIKTRQRALEEALFDRERNLAQSVNRCRHLEVQLDTQQSAHRADVALWQGEYEHLYDECGALRQEVLFLQESLAVTRAELITAEQECHRLERELEAAELDVGAKGASSLMAALEAADRTASVAELVAMVGDLEARTQRAMARELVSSASRSRQVEDVAALLTGLQQAGLHTHAETAVPALVMTRPVAETAALAARLHRAGLEDYVATLLRSSIELHAPADITGLALTLHRDHLGELAQSLLSAAFVVRGVSDVVAMTVWATDTEVEAIAVAALRPAAGRRSPQEVVDLSIALHHAGRTEHAQSLRFAVAQQRSAADVVDVIECFTAKGMSADADDVFAACQERGAAYAVALVQTLVQANRSEAAAEVVERSVRRWPVSHVATMISELIGTGYFPLAMQALMDSVSRCADTTRSLFHRLEEAGPGALAVLQIAAASESPERVAFLLCCLEDAGQSALAEALFHETLVQRPTGHAAWFLEVLHRSGAAAGQEASLYERARTVPAAGTAPLLLALAAATMSRSVSVVVRAVLSESAPAEAALLVKQLHSLDYPTKPRAGIVLGHFFAAVVHTWPVDQQVHLVVALNEAGLADDAAALIERASCQTTFKSTLKREQHKHAQKVLSLTFWQKRSSSTTPTDRQRPS